MRASIRVDRLLYRIGGIVSLSILALWLISLRPGGNLFLITSRFFYSIDNGVLRNVVLVPPGDPSYGHRWNAPLLRGADFDQIFDDIRWWTSPATYVGLSWPRFWSDVFRNGVAHGMSLPLWLPLLIVVFPTFLLWRSDRRRIPPGHCERCGYNLTGNTTGRCPECGQRSRERPEPTCRAYDTGAR